MARRRRISTKRFASSRRGWAGFFGGRGGSSGGKSGFTWRSVGIGLVVLVVAYGVWGVYQLDEQERGVIFRFGKVLPEAKQPGINWRPPTESTNFVRVNITRVESHSHQAEMLTEDDNIVAVNLTVQYQRVPNPIDYTTNVRQPRRHLSWMPRRVRSGTSSAARRWSPCSPRAVWP